MISMKEILKGRVKLEDLPKDVQENLQMLLVKINIVRKAYGKPLKVNDGYRRPADTPKNGASKSKHLIGAAVDIDDDEEGTFWKWCLQNLDIIADAGLFLEDPRWTHGRGSWVHFSIHPPSSGRRIFVPSVAPASAPNLWDGKYDNKKYDLPPKKP